MIDRTGTGVPVGVDVVPDLILHTVSELFHELDKASHDNQTLT